MRMRIRPLCCRRAIAFAFVGLRAMNLKRAQKKARDDGVGHFRRVSDYGPGLRARWTRQIWRDAWRRARYGFFAARECFGGQPEIRGCPRSYERSTTVEARCRPNGLLERWRIAN